MGNYLPVYKQLWTSTKFDKLDANGKLVYMCLLTSPLTDNTGIFKMLPKQIACYCNIDVKSVISAINKMREIGLIEYNEEKNLFYIYKMFHFTRGTIKNPKQLYKSILRHEQLVQNHEFWQLFKEENLSFYEQLKEFEAEQEQLEEKKSSSKQESE